MMLRYDCDTREQSLTDSTCESVMDAHADAISDLFMHREVWTVYFGCEVVPYIKRSVWELWAHGTRRILWSSFRTLLYKYYGITLGAAVQRQ